MPKSVEKRDKERIIESYQKYEDFIELAHRLEINEKTARTIIRRHCLSLSSGNHGGHKKKKINADNGDALLEYVGLHPSSTLKDMKDYLIIVCDLEVSESTIANFLDGKLITMKQIRDVPQERNSERVKEIRQQYARWFTEIGSFHNVIYIDEFGINLWTKRTYGRALKGSRCYRVVSGDRGNVSVCAAVSKNGILHHALQRKSFKKETFQQFITELEQICAPSDNEQFIFIVDNAPIHRAITTSNEFAEIKFLPPYSPFLNPIESVFSKVKNGLKSRLDEIRCNYEQPQRMEQLVNAIPYVFMEVNSTEIHHFYQHSTSFLTKCLLKEDIMGD